MSLFTGKQKVFGCISNTSPIGAAFYGSTAVLSHYPNTSSICRLSAIDLDTLSVISTFDGASGAYMDCPCFIDSDKVAFTGLGTGPCGIVSIAADPGSLLATGGGTNGRRYFQQTASLIGGPSIQGIANRYSQSTGVFTGFYPGPSPAVQCTAMTSTNWPGSTICSAIIKSELPGPSVAPPTPSRVLVGTTNGKVMEAWVSTGAPPNTLTIDKTTVLPTTPNSGIAPTHFVTSLSYDTVTQILLVSTLSGMIFKYYITDFATPYQLISIQQTGSSLASQGIILSNIVNGYAAAIHQEGADQFLSILDITPHGPADYGASTICVSELVPSGASSSVGAIYLASDGVYLATGSGLYWYELNGLETVTDVFTRAQYPQGNDLVSSIYRIHNYADKLSFVEKEDAIASGGENSEAYHYNEDYFEVSSIFTQFSDERGDVRRFTA